MVYAAALVLAFIGVLHSYLGERKLLAPLFRQEPTGVLRSPRARNVLRWAWHLTSMAWAALALLLAGAAGSGLEQMAVATVLALSISSAAICFGMAGPRHPGAIAFSICALLLAASRVV